VIFLIPGGTLVGLGRITRFAKTPPGAARFSVMRLGPRGLKILSPSKQLLSDFKGKKAGLMKGGMEPGEAHAEAFRLVNYRERFRREVLSNPDAVKAMRTLLGEAKEKDIYLMCMCPYKTPDSACHTYLLMEIAREMEPSVRLLSEPEPRGR
jgi:hypothetical protein